MREALLPACLIALASPALAVDGVIEINQARAEAGGVTATDTPGFPVTLGLPGAYRLTSNLDVTRAQSPENVTAIRIEANDVTLDLNGFGVFGPTTCQGFPFTCAPTGSGDLVRAIGERVVVRNGTLRGAGNAGVRLDAPRSAVERLVVSNCGNHGIWGASDTRVTGSTASLNGAYGIVARGLIQGNVASSNGAGGIYGSGGAEVSDNSVETNQGPGINQAGLVLRNVVTGNSGLGISASTAYGSNLIKDNNGLIGNPPQTSGGIELAPNVCGNDTLCP